MLEPLIRLAHNEACYNLSSTVSRHREMVNPCYALLARAMFQTVERLAATDVKHGDRLRLESYAYFVGAMSEAGQAVPVLQWHVRQAAAAKQRAMQAYVQQQLEHGKLWKLMEFSIVSPPVWLCCSLSNNSSLCQPILQNLSSFSYTLQSMAWCNTVQILACYIHQMDHDPYKQM